ncbi:MAG: ABC transporter ATP-binding protein [Bradymonadia bacterium]
MLVLDKVSKAFGSHQAVNELSMSVDAGTVCGFLGPNGAGKTTTMRMIAGIIQPSGGTILIDGMSVADNPVETKRIVGYVPDRPYLYEKLTAFEYLEFVAGLYQLPLDRGESEARRLLTLFGLGDVMHHEIESYSHGMKQRLVMSSVLLCEPKLMVVDEPMVGLDPKGARLLKDTLRQEAHEKGMAILLSTHSLDVAEEVCDDIVMIAQGRLLAQGTPSEIRALSNQPDGDLESVFIQLTAENTSRFVS